MPNKQHIFKALLHVYRKPGCGSQLNWLTTPCKVTTPAAFCKAAAISPATLAAYPHLRLRGASWLPAAPGCQAAQTHPTRQPQPYRLPCLTMGTSSMLSANSTITTTSLSTTTPITSDAKAPLASISFSTAIYRQQQATHARKGQEPQLSAAPTRQACIDKQCARLLFAAPVRLSIRVTLLLHSAAGASGSPGTDVHKPQQ